MTVRGLLYYASIFSFINVHIIYIYKQERPEKDDFKEKYVVAKEYFFTDKVQGFFYVPPKEA